MRIRGKLTVSFGIIILAVLSTSAFITYSTVARNINKSKDLYFSLKAKFIARKINHLLVESKHQNLLASRTKTTAAAAPHRDRELLQDAIDSRLIASETVKSIEKSIATEIDPSDAVIIATQDDVVFLARGNPSLLQNNYADLLRLLSHETTTAPIVDDHVYLYSARVGTTGCNLIYLVPGSIHNHELILFREEMIAASLIIMWISAWTILIVAHRLTRPIMTLTSATHDIMDHNYSTPLHMAQTSDEIGELAEAFETMRKKIRDLIVTDPLTDVYNRRYLMQELENELARAKRTRVPLSCLLIDIDHFKSINDTHGHICGDRVLQDLGQLLKGKVREYDLVARYGGEEFFILLPGADTTKAFEVAERIRSSVSEYRLQCVRDEIRFTLSIGITSARPEDTTQGFVERADKALYQAKTGRNKSVIFGEQEVGYNGC